MSEVTFEDVARVWAARRLGVDVRTIKQVIFSAEDGYSISTYTYESGEVTAEVTLAPSGRRSITTYTSAFPDLLDELVRAGVDIANSGQRILPPNDA